MLGELFLVFIRYDYNSILNFILNLTSSELFFCVFNTGIHTLNLKCHHLNVSFNLKSNFNLGMFRNRRVLIRDGSAFSDAHGEWCKPGNLTRSMHLFTSTAVV